MTRPSLRLTGLLIAVLVVGVALGFAAGTLFASRHPGAPFGRHGQSLMVDKLDHDLHLTAEQKVKIREILDRNFTALRGRRTAAQREMRASRDSTRSEIEAVLTDAQKEKYRRMLSDWESRWGHKRGPEDSPEH